MKVEFKSQYRWLLFLLIPFIIFLTIHISTPLTFFLSIQQPLVKYYTNQFRQSMEISLRSYTIQQSEAVSSEIGALASRLNILISLLQKNRSYLQINNSSFALNNACQYYHSNLSQVQPLQSMWYAQDKIYFNQLTPMEKAIFQQYGTIQPYIISSLKDLFQNGVIQGLFIAVNQPQNSISFHYPSYKQNSYSNINNTIITIPSQTFKNKSSGNTLMIYDSYGSNFKSDTVAICSSVQFPSASGVACLEINLNRIFMWFVHSFYILRSIGVYSRGQLVTPISTSQQYPPIVTNMEIINSSLSITYPKDGQLYTRIKNDGQIWSNQQCNIDNSTSFKTYRLNSPLVSIVPICIPEGGTWIPLAFYVFDVEVTDLMSDLNAEDGRKVVLKTLLIPIIISMLLFIILSVCIQRCLMKHIDYELYILDQRCKFISDGDTGVQIPKYEGTKDIVQVYEEVKIINTLFRYTSKDYFTGQSADKIMKYTQAIKLFQKIGYDSSFLYQNIGDCYFKVEEYQKSVLYLRKSVDLLERKMLEEYGYENFEVLRNDKEFKLTNSFKDNEIIIIRRLWKLITTILKVLQFKFGEAHHVFGTSELDLDVFLKEDQNRYYLSKYIIKFRQVLGSDIGSYSEGVLCFLFQAKFRLSINDFKLARKCWEKSIRYFQVYQSQYQAKTVRMKEKGSKNRFFHKRNRISGYSRCNPQIISSFSKYIEALLRLNNSRKKDYSGSFYLLSEALKSSFMNLQLNYLIMSQILKLLTELNIPLQSFESTQIFREVMPFKTLHYGQVTPQIQFQLYKIPKNKSESQMRQYVLMYDVGKMNYSSQDKVKLLEYMNERSEYIFDKQIKGIDRLSITKFNSNIQLETLCKLTLKESNQVLLKKTFKDILVEKSFKDKNWLLPSLSRVIYRIKKLQCQKIVIMFLRPLHSYLYQKKKRLNRKSKRDSSQKKINPQRLQSPSFPPEQMQLHQIGENICQMMKEKDMRNCKLILMCSKFDEDDNVVDIFGLKDINRRIWVDNSGMNLQNNIVYVVSQKHKADIQRILVSKLPNPTDNHIFIF